MYKRKTKDEYYIYVRYGFLKPTVTNMCFENEKDCDEKHSELRNEHKKYVEDNFPGIINTFERFAIYEKSKRRLKTS